MLSSILARSGAITTVEILICSVAAIFLGIMIAGIYMFRNTYSKSFVVTIALLPAIIQSVIMMVNGNIGAGVAVAGAFSLIRFRSSPGSAKEILAIFFAMSVGLACGMGFIVYAVLFTIMVGIAMIILNSSKFGEAKIKDRSLRVVITEDLDYTHLFDDLFKEFTSTHILQRVRTTNLGGLYELQYQMTLKSAEKEKELLDSIRQRNGNLTITCGIPVSARDEL